MGEIVVFGFFALIAYGYFANIYLLCTAKGNFSGLSACRALGVIIAPLGMVMGFIPNAEEAVKEAVVADEPVHTPRQL